MTDSREAKAAWIRSVLAAYEGQLTRYALRFVGDVERARDVVQETFLRLWKADREQVEDHVAEWLFTVCRNRAIDVRRKESRMTVVGEIRGERGPEQGRPPESPLDVTERRQATRGVLAAMEKLPEKQQEVIRLKFQNGLSYREISRVTGYSVTNVGYLLHTAIQKIRKQVGAPQEPALAAANGRRIR